MVRSTLPQLMLRFLLSYVMNYQSNAHYSKYNNVKVYATVGNNQAHIITATSLRWFTDIRMA